jgi:hypothetical protein
LCHDVSQEDLTRWPARDIIMDIPFRQHGEFTALVEGRLVISEVSGPWNRELVVNWCKFIYPVAKQLAAGGPHVGIAVVHHSLMCPPDAFDYLRDAISYSARQLGCIGNCIVHAPDVEGAALIGAMYQPLYDNLTPHLFCDSLDQAKAWGRALLAAKGY